jgi:hypothetical protein
LSIEAPHSKNIVNRKIKSFLLYHFLEGVTPKKITSKDNNLEPRHGHGGGGGGHGGKKKWKVKKKYKKFLLPLLLAYKLKFFTLIPVMIAKLILLLKTAGMAGFFFALFAGNFFLFPKFNFLIF